MKDDCLRKVARTVFVSLCSLSCATLFFLVFPFSKLLSPSMHSDIISQLDDYVIESLINWVNNKEKCKGKEINRRIILYFLYNNRFFLLRNSSFMQRIPPTGKLNSFTSPFFSCTEPTSENRSSLHHLRVHSFNHDHRDAVFLSYRSRRGSDRKRERDRWPTLVESIPGPFRARR